MVTKKQYRFIDLFAGIGGFHRALAMLGHECVFASELDSQLRDVYVKNFPGMVGRTFGDITKHHRDVPPHDILCAGFPCQPFSKSGYQNGHLDTRGTLFHDIVAILKVHKPTFVILENVGNFEQHDNGKTWAVAKASLRRLGYTVVATEHVKTGGRGLISPHHLGFPQTRERFFAVCKRGPVPEDILPEPDRSRVTNLEAYLQDNSDLDEASRQETTLTGAQIACIDHWNQFVQALPKDVEPPHFPLWTDEFGATYPFDGSTPARASKAELLQVTAQLGGNASMTKAELIDLLPSYARDDVARFPHWKVQFIRQNREWFRAHGQAISQDWLQRTRQLPPSFRKFEWNCKGEQRDLWKHILQFRPSGLRVKRLTSIPALVSLTTTQVPVVGPRMRFLSRIEALRLQGFPDDHQLPATREASFRALGNAVHVGVAVTVAARLLGQSVPDTSRVQGAGESCAQRDLDGLSADEPVAASM